MAMTALLLVLVTLSMPASPVAQQVASASGPLPKEAVEDVLATDDVCSTSPDEKACSTALLQKKDATGRRLAPPPTTPPETLEACLKGPGSAPHTYVGHDEYQVTTGNPDVSGQIPYSVKDVHNSRITNTITPRAVVFATQESHVVHAVSCAHKFGRPAYGRSGMNQYEASCSDERGGGIGCVLIDTNNLWDIGWPSGSETCQDGQDGCIVPLGPGLSLGSAYVKLKKRGYTIPAGTCAQVRVAGLTLGGGKGWLTRKYGMTLDRLRGIDAVLQDGTKVHANATNEPHLFWLARGGGGNVFPGIVTAFYFELVPIPLNPMTYSLTWDASKKHCWASVYAQWYKTMAINSDLDVFSRITMSNFGSDASSANLGIDMIYYGTSKSWAKGLLDAVPSDSGCQNNNPDAVPSYSVTWLSIVQGGNAGASVEQLEGNNCGWDLSNPETSMPTRTKCYGNDQLWHAPTYFAYRSLVMGATGEIPQGVWDSLAQQDMYQSFYAEIDPSNGAMADVPANATAYPHRGKGFVTLQQVMRADTREEIQPHISQSAELWRQMTSYVPKLGYYNYLDKQMDAYGGVPREAYYGENADTVDEYLREYTEGLNGCQRCESWELSSSYADGGR
jgi:hypothetical protein